MNDNALEMIELELAILLRRTTSATSKKVGILIVLPIYYFAVLQ